MARQPQSSGSFHARKGYRSDQRSVHRRHIDSTGQCLHPTQRQQLSNGSSSTSDSTPVIHQSKQRFRDVVCISDGSEDSKPLPRADDTVYMTAGPSVHRFGKKKTKPKGHIAHASATNVTKPKKPSRKTYIIREPGIAYSRNFDNHCVWGNKVKLYKKQVTNLKRLMAAREPLIHYYICCMSKTFATQRMYFSVGFSKKLRPYIAPKLYDLPIRSKDGQICIQARLINGVDKRATITKGWADFFHATHMKKEKVYAFAFKRSHKRLRLTVHAL